MAIVALLGTLDTKGGEYGWLRDRLLSLGVEVILIDTGVLGSPAVPADVSRAEVARAAGEDLDRLRAQGDRGVAVAAMARGAAEVVRRLHGAGRLHGILSVGGSGNSSIAGAAMRALPVGVPKLLVSSMASGDISPYVGTSDIAIMYSVVDIAGINRISARVLANAAAAIAGMAGGFARGEVQDGASSTDRPLVALTMLGVTTAGGDAARERLTALGYEVLVFHATGAGGRSMEALAAAGNFAGVLDLTLIELANELAGGVGTAGPDRLTAAGLLGVPQVVSLGALDMVKFGPAVPERYRDRHIHVHNSSVTVIRTTAAECAELGRRVAARLRLARGPVAVYLPLRGLSTLGEPGGPYHDPAADGALFAALRDGLAGSAVEIREFDAHLNEPAFTEAAADHLHEMITQARIRAAS